MEPERHPPNVRSITSSMADLGKTVKDLFQSEVRLAQAEIRDSTQNMGKHVVQAGVFGALAVIGILPFLAFLVIGLGEILGNNFWLSSLIVSLVCMLVGGPIAYRASKSMVTQDLTLPKTRGSLEYEAKHITEKVQPHGRKAA